MASKAPRRMTKSANPAASFDVPEASAPVESGYAAFDHAAQAIAAEAEKLAAATTEAGDQLEDVTPTFAAAEPAPLAAQIDDLVAGVAIAAPALPDPLAAAAGDTDFTPTVTEKAKKMIEDMNERAKTAMEKSSKMFEEANDFAKGNVEAIVESSKIAAKGLETLGQEAADYGRRSVESMTSAFKSFASVKSPTELFKLQSDYAKAAFEAMVAESTKTTEMVMKLAGDVAQPLSSRAAIAAEKVKLAA